MRDFQCVVYREGSEFVSQCIDIDIASCGHSAASALSNLREALELYFDGTTPIAVLPRISEVVLSTVAVDV